MSCPPTYRTPCRKSCQTSCPISCPTPCQLRSCRAPCLTPCRIQFLTLWGTIMLDTIVFRRETCRTPLRADDKHVGHHCVRTTNMSDTVAFGRQTCRTPSRSDDRHVGHYSVRTIIIIGRYLAQIRKEVFGKLRMMWVKRDAVRVVSQWRKFGNHFVEKNHSYWNFCSAYMSRLLKSVCAFLQLWPCLFWISEKRNRNSLNSFTWAFSSFI